MGDLRSEKAFTFALIYFYIEDLKNKINNLPETVCAAPLIETVEKLEKEVESLNETIGRLYK